MNRLALLPLYLTQGLWAARRTPRLPPADGPREGGAGQGATLNLFALGDSIIAGVGVETTVEALPAQLSNALANRDGISVRWEARGLNGARSAWLLETIDDISLEREPDLVVISNGINDVTTLTAEADVIVRLRQVIEAAEARFPDAIVVQLGLPPLGVFPALPQPLRGALGRRASRVDGALRLWMADRPRSHYLPFDAMPRPDQFAGDGYHPGPGGVAAWAEVLAERLGPLIAPAERSGS